MYVVGGLLSQAAESGIPAAVKIIGPRTVRAVVGLVLSTLLSWALVRLPETRQRPIFVSVVVGLTAALTGVVWYPLSRLIWYIVSRPPDMEFSFSCIMPCMVDHAWQMLIWAALFLAIRDLRWAYGRERDAEGAARSAAEARYRMLASQVHPHFLFNALNAIRALVSSEPVRAREVITEIGGFLRYSLGVDPSAMVPLHQEFEAVRRYLAVEEVRFGDRLSVTVQLDPAAANVLVPAFLLHPLVENAVTHGGYGDDGVLHLIISANVDAELVELVITNTGTLAPGPDGRPLPAAPSRGIGIQNVRERLALAFPGRHLFSLAEVEGRVMARVRVPTA